VQDLPERETAIRTEAVDYVDLTAELVSAYVSNNPVRPADLGALIASVDQALSSLGEPAKPAVDQIEKPSATQIKKSITPGCPHQLRGRQGLQDAAPAPDHPWSHPRGLPGEVRPTSRLPDDLSQLLGAAL
jgi:hypothetical protein